MAALVFGVLLCIGWWWPDHFAPWLAFHNEVFVFLALVVGLGISLWETRGEIVAIRRGAGVYLSAFLIAIATLQWLGGLLPFIGDLVLVILYLCGAALAWEMGRMWAASSEHKQFSALDSLALTFSAGATLSALIALIQWAGQEESWMPWVMPAAHSMRAIANLAQPNQLSTLLIMGMIATAVMYDRERLSGRVAALLLVVQTLVLVLTQSRTGMVVVLTLVAFAPWITGSSLRLRWWMVLAWGLSFLILTVAYQELGYHANKAAIGTEQVFQVGLRPLLWHQFGVALLEAPWLGYGWLQTIRAQQEGALAITGLEQGIYTHNHLLDLAIWLGLPCALLVLVAGARWIWLRRRKFGNKAVRWCTLWLLPLGAHAMLEFPLAYAYFLFPAAVIVGMVDYWTEPSRQQTDERQPIKSRINKWQLPLTLVVYASLSIVVSYEYLQAEEDFRVARFENRNLGQTPATYEIPKFLLLDQLEAALRAMRLKAKRGMPEEDIQMLGRAAARYPWLPLQYQYTLALALNGEQEKAAKQLRVMKGLFGEKVFADVLLDFLSLKQEKYPELAEVTLPE
ncbi:MAG: Wzy polymerase domain-containing protein [Burkholderiaceae bacterium]|jgi:hypothetical protein|nr:Wzy polymerase domain-containing protein [Burkholderiaceae bacterium]